MSEEFDSQDASENAGDDVLQTAPVKCRLRKAAFAQTSQAFAFAGRRISRCRAAMTPEQEKALRDAPDLAGELATLKIMLRRLRADVKSHPSKVTAS